MKIKIKSTQIYPNNVDEVIEEHEDALIENENGIINIIYDDGKIIIDTKTSEITIVRPINTFILKINEKKVLKYDTPYGKIYMETFGKRLDISYEPFKIDFDYTITFEDSMSYKVIMSIFEV